MKNIYIYESKVDLGGSTDIKMRAVNLSVFKALVKRYDKKSSITKLTLVNAFVGDNDSGYGVEQYDKVIWEEKA